MMIIVDLADEQEHLTELYEDATSCIPVLLENDEGLSLSEIYAPLLIEEDLDAMKRTRRPDEPSGSKTLDSVQGVFYIDEKLSTRILIKGEAGSGKSVFCLKLVESWSQLKQLPKHEHVCEKPSKLISGLAKDHALPDLLLNLYYLRNETDDSDNSSTHYDDNSNGSSVSDVCDMREIPCTKNKRNETDDSDNSSIDYDDNSNDFCVSDLCDMREIPCTKNKRNDIDDSDNSSIDYEDKLK